MKSNSNFKPTQVVINQVITPPHTHISRLTSWFTGAYHRNRLLLTFIIPILIILPKNGLSQFLSGYPTSSSPTFTVSSSTIHYMDGVRAHANEIYYVNSTLDGLTLDHRIGNFTVGDRVMIIQMITNAGYTTGYFEETTIQGIYNFDNTLQVDKLNRSFTVSTTVSTARVQVIKIPRYYKLTHRGIIRCHTWDGYTGGEYCVLKQRK